MRKRSAGDLPWGRMPPRPMHDGMQCSPGPGVAIRLLDSRMTVVREAEHSSEDNRGKVIVEKSCLAFNVKRRNCTAFDGLRLFDVAVECAHLTVDGRALVMCVLRTFAKRDGGPSYEGCHCGQCTME
jgi:RNase P/RNase MRP subunit p29